MAKIVIISFRANKTTYCADIIAQYYNRYAEHKGTQFVFSDLGTYKPDQWNPYSEIKRKLVEDHGIPEDQIRFIQEAKTEKKRKAMIEAMNEKKRKAMIEAMNEGRIRLETLLANQASNSDIIARARQDKADFESRVQYDKEGKKLNPLKIDGVTGNDPKVIAARLHEIEDKERTHGQPKPIGSVCGATRSLNARRSYRPGIARAIHPPYARLHCARSGAETAGAARHAQGHQHQGADERKQGEGNDRRHLPAGGRHGEGAGKAEVEDEDVMLMANKKAWQPPVYAG